MRGTLCAVLVWGCSSPSAAAQQPAAAPAQPAWLEPCVAGARPGFDVVSVKAIEAQQQQLNGARYARWNDAGVERWRRMILYAYNALHDFQLTGGPDWIATSTWKCMREERHARSGLPRS